MDKPTMSVVASFHVLLPILLILGVVALYLRVQQIAEERGRDSLTHSTTKTRNMTKVPGTIVSRDQDVCVNHYLHWRLPLCGTA